MSEFIKKGSELYNLFEFMNNLDHIPGCRIFRKQNGDFELFKIDGRKVITHYDVSYGIDNMIVIDVKEDRCVKEGEYDKCFKKIF